MNHEEQKRVNKEPSKVKLRQLGMVLRGYRQAAGLMSEPSSGA